MIYRVGVYALADGKLQTILNPSGNQAAWGQRLCIHELEAWRGSAAVRDARADHRKGKCRVAPPRVVLRDRK